MNCPLCLRNNKEVEMIQRPRPNCHYIVEYWDCPECKHTHLDVPKRGGPEAYNRISGSKEGLKKAGVSMPKVQEENE